MLAREITVFLFLLFLCLDLSATLRRIDLVTNLVAPILTGQVITFGSPVIGAIFLGVWNLIFMFLEYALLYKIYVRVKQLAIKEDIPENTENGVYFLHFSRNLPSKRSLLKLVSFLSTAGA